MYKSNLSRPKISLKINRKTLIVMLKLNWSTKKLPKTSSQKNRSFQKFMIKYREINKNIIGS